MNVIQKGPTITLEDQLGMCRQFTSQEIQDAFFSIPSFKSPGPDCYNSGFYKVAWGSKGTLICSAIQEFFHTGYMPKDWSATKLVVLPKVPQPLVAHYFRPISCCNTIYKCISKLLCQRIKAVLPHIIDQSQGAFVKGRELLYNVLISQDIARSYLRKHVTSRCLFKIDLQKSFDSVRWGFLQEMLSALKFPQQFSKWVMACVTSVEFPIHSNGQVSESFQGGRGLTQGDPLSPLLFVLSVEYLSRLVKLAGQ